MSVVAERVLERLGKRAQNLFSLTRELGWDPEQLRPVLEELIAAGRVHQVGPKYHITVAPEEVSTAPAKEEVMPQEQVCTGCGEPKPLSEYYTNSKRCKTCVLARQKQRDQERRASAAPRKKGGARSPKTARPRPAKVSADTPELPKAVDLAVIHTAIGVRMGPLVKSTGGLIQMPYHVDLSWEQFDELAEWRKGMK